MKKKDYTRSFNFFEYEQSLNEEKNASEKELKSIEELSTLETSFSVINAPDTTAKQNEEDAFHSVFDVDSAKNSTPQKVIYKKDIKKADVSEEIAEEITSKEIDEDTFTQKVITEVDEAITFEEQKKEPIAEPDVADEPDAEPFEFAIETVTPAPIAPAPTVKIKKSFLKAFKKQKEMLEQASSDEFFVEPVVSDIDKQQLTLDLDSEYQTDVTEENYEQEPVFDSVLEQSGQQFFSEAILDEIPAEDPQSIEDIQAVIDKADALLEEPAEEQYAEELNEDVIVNDNETILKESDEQPLDDEEENAYNFVLEEDEPATQENKQVFEQVISERKQEESLSKLITYNELKRIASDQFETPYLFKGKKGEHIRFRLSLNEEGVAKKAHTLQIAKEYIILIASALLIGLFLNFFIFTFAHVKGKSMEPTLHSNQITLVSRLEYQFSDIEHGDIIITRFPSKNYPDVYVKRVIALSLETIEIKDGIVYVNGNEISEDYISAPCPVDMAPITVPEGCVFVMGDNRPDSADSRIVGPVPKDKIIGKAKFVVFPSFKNIED